MEFKDTIIKLNEILKKNNLSLVDEFVTEYTKLLEITPKPQFFIDMNKNLIRRSYKVIVMLYGKKATFEHFETLINNYEDKGKLMIEECREKNLDLEDEIGWFLNDYYSSFYCRIGATKTYQHCTDSRNLIEYILESGLV